MIVKLYKIDDETISITGGCHGKSIQKENFNNLGFTINTTIGLNTLSMSINLLSSLKNFRSPQFEILLNNNYLGVIKVSQSNKQISGLLDIVDYPPIEIYNIGIGERFIFFYNASSPIGCAHHNNSNEFIVFANDEWIAQIISAYVSFLLFQPKNYSPNYITNDKRIVSKYDANFISDVIKDEPPYIRKFYNHLIHEHINQQCANNQNKKTLNKKFLSVIIFVFLFFSMLIGLTFVGNYLDYVKLKNTTPYYATNVTNEVDSFVHGTTDYIIIVKYEKDNEIVQETLSTDYETYKEYINKENFYFWKEVDRNEYSANYIYHIGSLSLNNFLDISTYVIFAILLFVIDGLLIFVYIKNKKT